MVLNYTINSTNMKNILIDVKIAFDIAPAALAAKNWGTRLGRCHVIRLC